MPTYEYVCSKCGHEFEKFQSMVDQPLTLCLKDDCGQKKWGRGKVKKKISAGAGLIFKGSGFYITDYRSDNYKESAKKDSASTAPAKETKSETKTESKATASESKPAAKAEPKPAKSARKS